MLKSSLISNLPKLKKNLGRSENLKVSRKIKDSFFKSKQAKRIKNSLTKMQTPTSGLKLSLNPGLFKESTLQSLQKVSEEEGELIVTGNQNEKMMRNGSRSLSTGNLSCSNDREGMETSYRRAETLKRSVAVKELRVMRVSEEIMSEEECDVEEKAFSQSSTNFQRKYYTLNDSERDMREISINKSKKQYDKKMNLNSKSLNVSSRQKYSNQDLNESLKEGVDIYEIMTVSQGMKGKECMQQVEVEKNDSLNEKIVNNKIIVGSGGSIENMSEVEVGLARNMKLKKNISLMNSKERKVEKIHMSKEFKISKTRVEDKLKSQLHTKLHKKEISRRVANDKLLQHQNFKKMIGHNLELKETRVQEKILEPLLSCKNAVKKKVIKSKGESFARQPYKKIGKISLQKEKVSQRDIEMLQMKRGSKEELGEERNMLRKKKKKKVKKDSKQGTLKLTTIFNEKFETAHNQTKIMRNKLLTKNSEMKHNWIKNIAGTKELLGVPNKLRNTKSRKRILDTKMVDVLHNKVRNFMPRVEEKKMKKSRQREDQETKTKNSSEQNQLNREEYKGNLSKTKSSARLLFMGRVNKPSFTKKNQNNKLHELKKLTDSNTIDRDKIKEEEFHEYLPDYTKYEMLGKGSYAEVYLCHHRESNSLVAIKIYERYKLTDEIRAENLRNEIEILKSLEHKNIIRMLDHIKGVNLEFIVMEKGPQRMLSEFVKQYPSSRLPNYDAKCIFEQIVESVLYLHKKEICHRDLKLQNILVDERFDVKLIDFGFATKTTSKLNVFCGTYSYMAPELVNKIPYDGKSTDVWSLGVVLYLMVIGDYPFKGCDESEITHNISNLNYYLPSNLDSSLRSLLESIFVVKPEERATVEDILSSDWLLISDSKSYDIKDHHSTIFMESTDYI